MPEDATSKDSEAKKFNKIIITVGKEVDFSNQQASPMNIVSCITNKFEGVEPKMSWGEISLFYNPGKALPNGVYFATLKEKDGENDKSSQLDRPQAFRLSLGIGKGLYSQHFGIIPQRPSKGGIVDTGHDFSVFDTFMPHPIYAWMGWACILNPSSDSLNHLWPEIYSAYGLAVDKFKKRKKQSQTKHSRVTSN